LVLEAEIGEHVVALCETITENSVNAIRMNMSLTHALGFDSLQLMQFFAGVEQRYPGVALEDWFIEHSSDGRDTLDSAVSHLMRFLNLHHPKG
jgi:acyl carrier protein